jgi:hypothetical protein
MVLLGLQWSKNAFKQKFAFICNFKTKYLEVVTLLAGSTNSHWKQEQHDSVKYVVSVCSMESLGLETQQRLKM